MNLRDVRIITPTPDLLDKFSSGLMKAVDAIGSTMGPRGSNVVIERQMGDPEFTKDGVTVAREIFLPDSDENMAARAVAIASIRTNATSGDGTTTTAVLAEALFLLGRESMAKNETPPLQLRRHMESAVNEVEKEIRRMSVRADADQLRKVAQIASDDPVIGDLVHSVLSDDPRKVVMIDEEGGAECSVEDMPGFRFQKGWLSPAFVTDRSKGSAELDDVSVLVYDGRLSDADQLMQAISEGIVDEKRQTRLLVIAEEVEGSAMVNLILNAQKGGLKCVAVKAPFTGTDRTDFYRDVASLTGGHVLTHESFDGSSLPKGFMGLARHCSVTRYATTVTVAEQSLAARDRSVEVAKRIAESKSQVEKDRLTKRLAILSGRISVIHAGGATDSEVKEVRQRIEDAVQAVAAASAEGILPGGGNALACIGRELTDKEGNAIESFATPGRLAVFKAVSAPACRIHSNAGAVAPEFEWNAGLDIATLEKSGDLIAHGIIDPAMVAREALRNAMSVAGLLLTCGRSITFVEHSKTSRDL